jgi:hypothetical protein
MSRSAQVLSMIVMLALVAISWRAAGSEVSTDVASLLQSKPSSMEAFNTPVDGRQYVGDIRRNIEKLYGVSCVLEVPPLEKGRPEPFPSPDLEYMPCNMEPETTLGEFLDATCSEGRLQWGVVRNTIHIWPVAPAADDADYLDTTAVSLDIQGASVLDAVKAWATAVNTNREPKGLGVTVTHTSDTASMRKRDTPASLRRAGAVTVKVDNVTAREALCAIAGASREWVSVHYFHSVTRPDKVRLFASQEEIRASPEISIEQREVLDAQEDLASVLVEPAMTGKQR